MVKAFVYLMVGVDFGVAVVFTAGVIVTFGVDNDSDDDGEFKFGLLTLNIKLPIQTNSIR